MIQETSAEIEALKRSIQASRIDRAKSMPQTVRLLEGARLFDMVRMRMLDGIRNQFPGWTEQQVCEEFHNRLEIQRRHEEPGTFWEAYFIQESNEVLEPRHFRSQWRSCIIGNHFDVPDGTSINELPPATHSRL